MTNSEHSSSPSYGGRDIKLKQQEMKQADFITFLRNEVCHTNNHTTFFID